MLEYGVPASFAAVSWVGFRNCDYAIVGARLGVLQAGLYFRAYNLGVEYQKKVSLVLGQVGFPILARTGSPAAMAAARGEMVRLLTIALFPLLAILAITAPVLVPWIFGDRVDARRRADADPGDRRRRRRSSSTPSASR